MATDLLPAATDASGLDRIQAENREPEWLLALRRDAWERYQAAPMPSKTDERWRRTDISKLDMARVQPALDFARLDVVVGFEAADEGAVNRSDTREGLLQSGVIFGGLGSVVGENPERFRARLEQAVPADASKFELLARAVGADGYAVFVPKGVDVTVPLRARVVSREGSLPDETASPDTARAADLAVSLERGNLEACVFPRSIIVAEAGSRVTVVEDYRAEYGIGPYVASGLTEVYVGEGAEVTIVSLQDWSAETWNFHTQRSYVERDGKIVTLTVQLGGKVSKVNVEGSLVGANASSRMLGLLYGDGRQHFDLYTLQDHQADATFSDLLFKNALSDESKSIYSGLIRVDEKVIGADAYQSNRNLMLSEKAKADSQPMLEILNNEVRCTHGASMGPVDAEQVFYLQSRGLPKPEAERMVVQGFFEEALGDIRDEATRVWVHDRIAEKIGVE